MTTEMREEAREVYELGKRVALELGGNPPEIVLMVLADMVALWLAGHIGPGKEVTAFRKAALKKFIATVDRLIPINERMILEAMAETSAKKHH